jgi:hypothetical protein
MADQLLRCRIKGSAATFLRQSLKSGQSLTPTLTGIASTGLLQVAEGLLAEAAVVPACPLLHQLMQWIGQVTKICIHVRWPRGKPPARG